MNEGRILVSGAGGLVGRALAARRPVAALRRGAGRSGLWWDPEQGRVSDDGSTLSAVVHLAGEPIAEGRWTAARRKRIERSRIDGTRTLVDWLASREQRPSVLVSASAVGFYGDRGDEELPESAGPGTGFLADLCRAWEAEAARAEQAGIRVVCVRLGLVLARRAGVLGRLEPLFRLGAGGPVGSGRQWFPWVHVDDVTGAIEWALERDEAHGAYNLVAPGCVRQAEFARSLGRALGRPALLPAPAFALRLAFGEMADEALLASQRVRPDRLRTEGFAFTYPELPGALEALLR